MWPKALLELLPHLTRLVPLANTYFQSRSGVDDASRVVLERKLDEVGAALRGDLERAAASSADLSGQLTRQSGALAELSAGVQGLQSQLAEFETRLSFLEKRSGSLASTLVITHILTLVLCILLVAVLVLLFLHLHR